MAETASGIEVELKYLAPEAAGLDRLAALERLADTTLAPGRAIEELDRYLDTADGRLAAARWACRLRTQRGTDGGAPAGATTIVSLKGPRQDETGPGALHSRPEVEGPAPAASDPAAVDVAAWPPSEARTLLAQLTGGAPLRERFRLRQRRLQREVRRGTQRVGLLTLDRVLVERGDTAHGRLACVELELAVEAGDPLVDRLDGALRGEGLEPDRLTKLQHALALLGEADS